MTAMQFCYWLTGYFEISENEVRKGSHKEALNQEQLHTIRRALDLVFETQLAKDYPALAIPAQGIPPGWSPPPMPTEVLARAAISAQDPRGL